MVTSTQKQRIPLDAAQAVASDLAARLAPACERIIMAGSLRRQKPEIGDIELVAIPRTTPLLDMFGEPTGSTVSDLDCLLADMCVTFTKNGPRYKQFFWHGMPVDLFLTTPPQWGLIATIRTGSSAFSQRLVTPRRHGGLLPSHLKVKDGWVWDGPQTVPTPEEADLFDLLEIDWIEPWNR